MHEKCEDNGRGNCRRVRQLLVSRKVTPAGLDFIKVMRAGQKAQKKEDEMRKQE